MTLTPEVERLAATAANSLGTFVKVIGPAQFAIVENEKYQDLLKDKGWNKEKFQQECGHLIGTGLEAVFGKQPNVALGNMAAEHTVPRHIAPKRGRVVE